MYDQVKITRVTTTIAGIVAVVVALLFPIGYFSVSYQHLTGSLEAEAEITSRIVTDVINDDPEMWHLQQTRIVELLSRRTQNNPRDVRRVFDLQKNLVAESLIVLKPPLLTRNFDLLDSGFVVGTLEIRTSLFPLLLRSGLALLLGLCCGVLIFVTLRVLPMRAVVKAERALRTSEVRYRRLVEKAPNAILVYNKEQILYANRAAFQLFGTKKVEQLVGQKLTALFHPENSELLRECFQVPENEDGFDIQQELRLARFDGTPLDVVAVGIRTEYLGEPAVQVILHDITERKRLQDELSGKVEQLETALATVKLLEGIIPICMYCKKIRDDQQGWHQLERYITEHSEAMFSHGICPDCFEKTMKDLKDMEGGEHHDG
jgi:PAS domain S-box-containing protein